MYKTEASLEVLNLKENKKFGRNYISALKISMNKRYKMRLKGIGFYLQHKYLQWHDTPESALKN